MRSVENKSHCIIMNVAYVLPLFIILIVPNLIMAQDGLTQFTGSLSGSVSKIFGYVKITVTVGLLLYTIWPFYHALVGEGDKSRYWWQVIGIAVFLIILNIFPTVFNSLFGTNVTITQ